MHAFDIIFRFMRPCTPHYVLTLEPSIVMGKHFFCSNGIMDSCHGVVHSLLGDHIVTNTAHPQTLHCLVAILSWWVDLRLHSSQVDGGGLDCM